MNIVWFRSDLRVYDNPALYYASKQYSDSLVAVYLYSKTQFNHHHVGENQQALIIKQLQQLKTELKKLGVALLVIESDFNQATFIFAKLAKALKADNLFFNVEVPFDERQRDKAVVNRLQPEVNCQRFYCDSLVPPWKIVNQSNLGYKVFTPFAKAVNHYISEKPLFTYPKPKARQPQHYEQTKNKIKKLSLLKIFSLNQLKQEVKCKLPLPNISYRLIKDKLNRFCEQAIFHYANERDYPCKYATSNLSAALALGAISVTECYLTAEESINENKDNQSIRVWQNELVWRDFYRSIMWHYPKVCKNLAFKTIDSKLSWQRKCQNITDFFAGKTGIPIIDAAIKQMITTGFMHNRLRMIVASYFCKNLWADWRLGERFFAQHLLDYDFASNNGGWQWSASIGTDAAPYFRVFNPQSQQQKYDPNALFIKQWLPQLKQYSAKEIHRFNNISFDNYESCAVDLKATRKQAIAYFRELS